MLKIKDAPAQEHKHRWIKGQGQFPFCDQPYKGHNCNALRVTVQEYDELMGEWNNYYEMVQSTPAYRDYQKMRVAFKDKNKPLITEIDQLVMARSIVSVNRYGEEVIEPNQMLSQPEYPDPGNNKQLYYVETLI